MYCFCCVLACLQLVQVTAYPFGEQKSEFTLGVSGVLDLPLDYVLYASCKIPSEDGKHPPLGLFASFTMPAKYGQNSRNAGSGRFSTTYVYSTVHSPTCAEPRVLISAREKSILMRSTESRFKRYRVPHCLNTSHIKLISKQVSRELAYQGFWFFTLY